MIFCMYVLVISWVIAGQEPGGVCRTWSVKRIVACVLLPEEAEGLVAFGVRLSVYVSVAIPI